MDRWYVDRGPQLEPPKACRVGACEATQSLPRYHDLERDDDDDVLKQVMNHTPRKTHTHTLYEHVCFNHRSVA